MIDLRVDMKEGHCCVERGLTQSLARIDLYFNDKLELRVFPWQAYFVVVINGVFGATRIQGGTEFISAGAW